MSGRRVDPDDPTDRQAGASMLATHHPVGCCRAPGGPGAPLESTRPSTASWAASASARPVGHGRRAIRRSAGRRRRGWCAIGQGGCPDRCLIGPSVRVSETGLAGAATGDGARRCRLVRARWRRTGSSVSSHRAGTFRPEGPDRRLDAL